ncbi:MAG: Asp-tRNA(Asn)/Glu-tRNA(Gln) amidotransferase GatCAB subunit A, partial [Candidatus Hydrogenedentota bacterium]
MSEEYIYKTAHELHHDLRAGRVTATALAEAQYVRIEAVDGDVKAYLETWQDTALEKAQSIDDSL